MKPDEIDPVLQQYLLSGRADNTRRAYACDLKHFAAWGGTIPATPEQVAQYLAAHAQTHKSTTLLRRTAAIAWAHAELNVATPTASALVKGVLHGIQRRHGTPARQVKPISLVELKVLLRTPSASAKTLAGLRNRALLLIGFAGAFRRSELASLTLASLQFTARGVLIHLERSKTDQVGRGRSIAIPVATGARCPVKTLQRWLSKANIQSGAIFRMIDQHGNLGQSAITPQSVSLLIKRCCTEAGLDAHEFSGHSLRAGLVTAAANAGEASWRIRAHTGHKSDAMLARYIRAADAFGASVRSLL